MGSELIVRIFTGPRVLPKEGLVRAERYLRPLEEVGKELSPLIDANKYEEALQLFEEKVSDKEYPLYSLRSESWNVDEVMEAIADLDVDTLLSNFQRFWPGNTRDSFWRKSADSDEHVIVVAGDTTWGDVPDGDGYRILSEAYYWDILPFFNIH